MDAKQLIEENNHKRTLLTKKNEAYYEDLLVYIRLQFSLSDQQSEEVLMEMLDHLIDGQKEGKTANEIFGDDPIAFANELIVQIPKEEKKDTFLFIGGLILQILSWVLLIRGGILLISSFFLEVNTAINLFHATITACVIGILIIFILRYILKQVEKSLFQEKDITKGVILKSGLISGLCGVVIFAGVKIIPEIGPSFPFNWWMSIIVGMILLICHYILEKYIAPASVI